MLAHISREPPRKSRELPGLAPRKYIKRLVFPLLPFVLFCALIPLLIFTTDKEFKAQFTKMDTVQGQVLEVSATHAMPPQNFQVTTVKYVFKTPQGKIFYGSSNAPKNSPFAILKPGAPVPILFDPEDPTFNGIAGVLGKNAPPIILFLFFPLLPFLFVVPMFLVPLLPIFRASKIFRTGKLTTGRIYFVTRSQDLSMSRFMMPQSEVLYTFEDENGHTVQGRQTCDNDWLLNKMDVGTEVTVVYIPKQSKKSIFLEPFIA